MFLDHLRSPRGRSQSAPTAVRWRFRDAAIANERQVAERAARDDRVGRGVLQHEHQRDAPTSDRAGAGQRHSAPIEIAIAPLASCESFRSALSEAHRERRQAGARARQPHGATPSTSGNDARVIGHGFCNRRASTTRRSSRTPRPIRACLDPPASRTRESCKSRIPYSENSDRQSPDRRPRATRSRRRSPVEASTSRRKRARSFAYQRQSASIEQDAESCDQARSRQRSARLPRGRCPMLVFETRWQRQDPRREVGFAQEDDRPGDRDDHRPRHERPLPARRQRPLQRAAIRQHQAKQRQDPDDVEAEAAADPSVTRKIAGIRYSAAITIGSAADRRRRPAASISTKPASAIQKTCGE